MLITYKYAKMLPALVHAMMALYVISAWLSFSTHYPITLIIWIGGFVLCFITNRILDRLLIDYVGRLSQAERTGLGRMQI